MRIYLAVTCVLLLTACSAGRVPPPLITSSATPPLITIGNQTAQRPRERAYLACAAALYQAYASRGELRLQQRYQVAFGEGVYPKELHLQGHVRTGGQPEDAYFVCTTGRFGRQIRVLNVHRVSPVRLE
jgi:hypothetical protein